MGPSGLKQEAKTIPIVSYLGSLGFFPLKESGSYYYYLSPLPGRNEKTPSFLVRKKDNRWNDRGINSHWDDVLSLVMNIEKCNLKKAIDKLLGAPKKIIGNGYRETFNNKSPAIEIKDVSPLKDNYLIKYLKRRKINIELAKKYCSEAIVVFPFSNFDPGKQHLMIAFKNDLGGYEFRCPYLKISSSPKYYTTIKGRYPDHDIFEGFIDFLSWLTYKNIEVPKNNSYILNSLIFLPFLYEKMTENGTNNIYINHGNAAEKSLLGLKENNVPFIDRRGDYLIYEDINDMLTNHAMLK